MDVPVKNVVLATTAVAVGVTMLARWWKARQVRVQRRRHRPPPPGSWALVTGGTKGIGFAYAVELLRRGHRIIITGTRESTVGNAVRDLEEMYPQSKPGRIVGVVAKMENTEACLKEIKAVVESCDSFPTVVVLNAGIEDIVPLEIQNENSLMNTLQANTVTTPALTRYFINGWMTHKTGPLHQNYLFGCSSMTSFVPIAFAPAYTCSRVFQSYFFGLLSEQFVAKQSLHDVARVVLVETPVVWTRHLEELCEAREQMVKRAIDPTYRSMRLKFATTMNKTLKALAITPMKFAQDVLREGLDDGELEIVIGHRIRFMKWMHNAFGAKMGWARTQEYMFAPHIVDKMDTTLEWVQKEMSRFSL